MKSLSIFLLFISALSCLADSGDYTEVKQKSYYYIANRAFFETTPPVKFSVKDFTRTNEMLAKKYESSYSDGKGAYTLHLDVFVVPTLTDNQYSLRIYSDHPLKSALIHDIDLYTQDSMLTRK